jgi:glucose/arabinose dehydrogenase
MTHDRGFPRRAMGINMQMRTRSRLVSLAAGLALLLAACGSGDDQAAAPAASNAPQSPSVSAPPSVEAEESPRAVEPANASPAAVTPQTTPEAATTTEASAAATVFDPAGVEIGLEVVGTGFDQPLFVTHAGDGSGRVFVAEKTGRIKTLDGRVFLDISDRVNARSSERGLLGLAFDPQFGENGVFFVHYSDANGDTAISRFRLGLDADAADPGSEEIILRVQQPAANHNGGMIEFGPDGYLYIGLGDGGGANDQFGNGQNMQTLLGKLLRIDVSGETGYTVPADNPFVNNADVQPEIWAFGLRNPWRFSWDRATGDLYIGDVGQNRYEMIHMQPSGDQGGENFGWPILEGTHCFQADNCDRSGLDVAVIDYPHNLGCSVTGGYVYRGSQFPALQGAYVFGDYCSGRMWTLSQANGAWTMNDAMQTGAQISSFGEDEAGELYMTDLASGTVYRVTGNG